MKTILWATLTANGNYAQSSAENPPKPETLADFAMQARTTGNFIVGRKTFDSFAANGGGPFADLDIVVVSQSVKEIPGVKLVGSPQEALTYLQAKGHQRALLAGGAHLHNTFLGQGLVDEVIFNVAPVLEGKGFNLVLGRGHDQYQGCAVVGLQVPWRWRYSVALRGRSRIKPFHKHTHMQVRRRVTAICGLASAPAYGCAGYLGRLFFYLTFCPSESEHSCQSTRGPARKSRSHAASEVSRSRHCTSRFLFHCRWDCQSQEHGCGDIVCYSAKKLTKYFHVFPFSRYVLFSCFIRYLRLSG